MRRGQTVLHRYFQSITLSQASADTPVYETLKLNDIYALGLTGAHQPYGFDQISPLYRHYRVVDYRIKLRFRNTNSAGTNTDQLVWYRIHDDAVHPTAVNALRESGLWKTFLLRRNTTNDSERVRVLRPHRRFVSVRKDYYTDPQYRGDNTGSPTTPIYLHFGTVNQDTTSASASCVVDVMVEFKVLWTDPISQTQS